MKAIIIKTTAIILLAFAAAGCENLLTEDPKGQMTPDGFFKTPADVKAVIHGAYAEWVTVQMEKSFLLALMLRSDMVDIGDRNTLGDRISINDFSLDANNTLLRDGWRRMYQSISAANTAVQAARAIEAEEAVKNELEAQARFIRAYSYYHLVRCFGDVPFMDTPIESAESLAAIGRTPKEEVYDHIIEDLVFAKTHLPDQNTSDVRNIGTRGSAATTLAEVYLTLRRYGEAAGEARFVIDNASAFNYALENNYQDLFNANLSGTLREPVFTIDLKNDLTGDGGYNQMDGMVNLTRVRDYAPRSLSVAVPSMSVFQSWDERDYRKGVGFEDSLVVDGKKTALTETGFRVPRPHIAKYFRYPGPQESGDDRSSDHHYCLFRYADVLLIAAEAIAESEGATTEAIGYLNQIRARARFNGGAVTNFPAEVAAGISKEELIAAIREERRLEFAFEFKRWYDIKRWNILEDAFTGPGSLEPHAVDPSRDYLFPIPQTEIDIAGLEQNPGY